MTRSCGWCVVLVLTAVFVLPGTSRLGSRLHGGENYAVLVAVGGYDQKHLRPLDYARNDILEFAEALKTGGFKPENIVLLHDDVTKLSDVRFTSEADKILKELRLLLGALQEEDTLVVAFAGHGVQFAGEAESYFCARDADLEDPQRKGLISLSSLYDQLKQCPARRKLLLVDACRNDPQSCLSRSRDTVKLESVTKPQLTPPPQGVVALFSCAEGQEAYESPDLKHGVFFYHVLQAWKGWADRDPELTLDELIAYTKRGTATFARTKLGALQTPRQQGFFEGEWVLRVSPRPEPSLAGVSVAPGTVSPPAITTGVTGPLSVSGKLGSEAALPAFLTTESRYERVEGGGIRLQGAAGGSRQEQGSVRTLQSDFLSRDFTYEVLLTFAPGDRAASIGLGPGKPDRSYNGLMNSVYLRFNPPNISDGIVNVTGFRKGSDNVGHVGHQGVHSVKIIKEGDTVAFLVDPANDGPTDDDMELIIPNIREYAPFFDARNVPLFFGESGTFLEASVVASGQAASGKPAGDDLSPGGRAAVEGGGIASDTTAGGGESNKRLGGSRSLPSFLTTTALYRRTRDGGIRLPGADSGVLDDARCLRTRDVNYLTKDFTLTVALTFEPGDKIAYVGLGPGLPHQSYNGFTDSIYLRFHSPKHGDGLVDVTGFRKGNDGLGKVGHRGTHLVRIVKQGDVVSFLVDPAGDGPTDDDLKLTIPNIREYAPFFHSKNMPLFFGGSGTFLEASIEE